MSSCLLAKPEVVWRHAVSPAGVNRDFRPLLRMTFPAGVADLTDGWRPGERLFRSWLFVAGLVPVEYDDLALSEVEPGRRFLKRSSLLTQQLWEHERIIEPALTGCRLTDRVRFVTKLPWLEAAYGSVFKAIFRWRQRNLRKLFGEAAA